MKLQPDAEALLLLGSQLAVDPDVETVQFSARELAQLSNRITAASLSGPGALLDLDAGQIQSSLEMAPSAANRMAQLLSRRVEVQRELSRLEENGIWVATRADDSYPARLMERLKDSAPAVLFGAGSRDLIGTPGLAVVGSRNVDESGQSLSEFIGAACARCRLTVYSGAARGVDAITMGAALNAGGTVVGVLADSLEKAIRARDARAAIENEKLALVTPYHPSAGFTVGAAMGRNKLIYALADYGLVIASDLEKGGTWAGATDALKLNLVPLFVVDGPKVADGNKALLERGAYPFPSTFDQPASSLRDWLEANAKPADTSVQYSLF